MLRGFVIALGILCLAGAIFALTHGAGAATIPFFILGALFIIGTIFERSRYKQKQPQPPGPDWQQTTERFTDPNSNETTNVWFNKTTGERRYVQGQRSES